MTKGNDELHFFYDAQNRPAVVVYNGTAYAYVKNLQGDVIAILDSTGAVVVSYAYDAWGQPIGKAGTLASTLGTVQPFRYRGYVYDEDTGLYYLRSRYYDVIRCRFVNCDAILACSSVIGKLNIYSYCRNNPIVSSDASGRSEIVLGGYGAYQGLKAAALWILKALGIGATSVGTVYLLATSANNTTANDNDETQTTPAPGPAPSNSPVTTPAPPSQPQPPKYPGDDPMQAPDGYEWRGRGPQGSGQGNYHNPETGESLHPDLNHPEPIGPHWDYWGPDGINTNLRLKHSTEHSGFFVLAKLSAARRTGGTRERNEAKPY